MRQDPRFPNLFIVDHPLVQHKLSHMRDRATSTRTFRELLREITLLLGYEVTRGLPLTTRRIDTPLTAMDAPVIAGKKLVVVPVLRAGLGMADGLLELIPSRTGNELIVIAKMLESMNKNIAFLANTIYNHLNPEKKNG